MVLRQGLLVKCGYPERALDANREYQGVPLSVVFQDALNKSKLRTLASLGQYQSISDLPQAENLAPYRQVALANAFDVAGRRNKALEVYRKILSDNRMPEAFRSVAKTRLTYPFARPKQQLVAQAALSHCTQNAYAFLAEDPIPGATDETPYKNTHKNRN